MRKVDTKKIKEAIKNLLLDANINLGDDIYKTIKDYRSKETSPIGETLLDTMIENIEIARNTHTPICQDTGIVIVFLEIGQDVILTGEYIEDSINTGVKEAYNEGYFRKSVVESPFVRKNTKDNTPAIIYYNIVKGDKIIINIMPKGFGSENCSATKMLTPAEGYTGVIDFVIDTVKKAGSKPCPPIIIGVGIGGSAEKSALLAKQALLININEENKNPLLANMEKELLTEVNKTGIGPGGLGGNTTALSVKILDYPTHIAGLPVSVNIGCHVSRHKKVII